MRLNHRLIWLGVITAGAACTAGRTRPYGNPPRSTLCDGDAYLEVANFTDHAVQIYATPVDGSKVPAFVGTAQAGTTRLRLEGTPGANGIYFTAQVNREQVPSGVNITRRCDPR